MFQLGFFVSPKKHIMSEGFWLFSLKMKMQALGPVHLLRHTILASSGPHPLKKGKDEPKSEDNHKIKTSLKMKIFPKI